MKNYSLPLLATALLTTQAAAHSLPGTNHDLSAGLIHPLIGLDHLLAIIAVGIGSARCTGRTAWIMPLLFIAGLTAGALASITFGSIPFVESGVATSVLLFGLVVALAIDERLATFTAIVPLFAFFHGQVHAAGLGTGADSGLFIAGLLAATAALLIAAHVLSRRAIRRSVPENWFRLAGGSIAAAGLAMMFGII